MVRTASALLSIALLTACLGPRLSEGAPVTNEVETPPQPVSEEPPASATGASDPDDERARNLLCVLAGECEEGQAAAGGVIRQIRRQRTRGLVIAGPSASGGQRPNGHPTLPRVITPTSPLGVRGTTFAVRVEGEGDGPDQNTGTSGVALPVVSGAPRQAVRAIARPVPSAPATSKTTPSKTALTRTDPCNQEIPEGLNLPIYPQWPPEEASSRVALDRLIGARDELSLYDTGDLLREALSEAGYQQHAFYAVPGGYILVTETERIDAEGRSVSGVGRYQKPGEDRTGLLVSIRDLFLERPETYYRYLAIVVSDTPFCGSTQALEIEEASQRVRLGLSDLSNDTRGIEFDDAYRVTALIYEFINDGIGYDLKMVAPGRIPPQDHLAITGLEQAIPDIFERARREARGADAWPED